MQTSNIYIQFLLKGTTEIIVTPTSLTTSCFTYSKHSTFPVVIKQYPYNVPFTFLWASPNREHHLYIIDVSKNCGHTIHIAGNTCVPSKHVILMSVFNPHCSLTEQHPCCAVINNSHIHQQHTAVLLQQYCNVITSSLQCHNSSCINGIGGVKMYANFFFFVFSFKGKFTCWTIYLL